MTSNRRRSYIVTCDEDEDTTHARADQRGVNPTTPNVRTYASSPISEADDSPDLAEEYYGLGLDAVLPNAPLAVGARYDTGSEKMAPKLIKKLKKQMDVVIENFEKISREHLVAKEELDKVIKEESELAYELERVQDETYDLLYGTKSDLYQKYGKAQGTTISTPPFLLSVLQALETFVGTSKNTGENISTNMDNQEFATMYKTLQSDSDIMEKHFLSQENKVASLTEQMKNLDKTNQGLVEKEEQLKRDANKRVHNRPVRRISLKDN